MILCDVGNSFAKLYFDQNILRLNIEELEKYKNEKVFYINVNEKAKQVLAGFSKWIDLAPYVRLQTEYEGLGIDRKVACLGIKNGVVIDAGSAVTVDVMQEGVHRGGFIYPGKKALRNAFKTVSPLLDRAIVPCSNNRLPLNTQEAISYGYYRPLIALVESFELPVVVTGGDGKEFFKLFTDAIYDEFLIFKSMEKIVQRNNLC